MDMTVSAIVALLDFNDNSRLGLSFFEKYLAKRISGSSFLSTKGIDSGNKGVPHF
jgi:hypothetical protein